MIVKFIQNWKKLILLCKMIMSSVRSSTAWKIDTFSAQVAIRWCECLDGKKRDLFIESSISRKRIPVKCYKSRSFTKAERILFILEITSTQFYWPNIIGKKEQLRFHCLILNMKAISEIFVSIFHGKHSNKNRHDQFKWILEAISSDSITNGPHCHENDTTCLPSGPCMQNSLGSTCL